MIREGRAERGRAGGGDRFLRQHERRQFGGHERRRHELVAVCEAVTDFASVRLFYNLVVRRERVDGTLDRFAINLEVLDQFALRARVGGEQQRQLDHACGQVAAV